jgi:hypothetical protein
MMITSLRPHWNDGNFQGTIAIAGQWSPRSLGDFWLCGSRHLVTYDRQEDASLANLLSSLKDMAAAAETSPSKKLGGSRNGNTMNN